MGMPMIDVRMSAIYMKSCWEKSTIHWTSTRATLILIRDSKPMGRRIPLGGDYPEGINLEDFDEAHTVACTREDIREGFVMNNHMGNLISNMLGSLYFR